MYMIHLVLILLALLCPVQVNAQDRSAWDEETKGPLPRWRLNGTPAPDYSQGLQPYALNLNTLLFPSPLVPPTSGLIQSPAEYAPMDGVLYRFSTGSYPAVVTEMVAKLTGDPAQTDRAYVIVKDASQQSQAESLFLAAGADLAKVDFITLPTDSIWIRDYGPHFIWLDGARVIVDSHYYIIRYQDNFIPTNLADTYFDVPAQAMGLFYSGGNFQAGPGRTGFITSLIAADNPGFSNAYIEELFQDYQGIDTLHVFPQLPFAVDLSGHIDMWMYITTEDRVVISEMLPGSDPTAIQITENAAVYMQNLGFQVYRSPDHTVGYNHYTYTNAFRVNDRIFIPRYADGDPAMAANDAAALAAFQAAAPGVEILTIDCYDIITAGGAIHCTVKQVPRYTAPEPSVHLSRPDGEEILVPGTTEALLWAATDDQAVTSVDLYLSKDGGATYPELISAGETDDGRFDWTVPTSVTTQARVKVVATDSLSNSDEDVSETDFSIQPFLRSQYTFATGAGLDRWAWGHQTNTWAELDGIRYPSALTKEINEFDAQAYVKLGASDAETPDVHRDRYVSPNPSGLRESTHVFEFTLAEAPAAIRDIGISWEGYGDDCLQVELYVWDHTAGNWGDGTGLAGENRYMANFAGNRDEVLAGHLRSDFNRYLDGENKLTLLVYAERFGQPTFHDFMEVTVTHASLLADAETLSAATGGTVNFDLLAGQAQAGRWYVILGTMSGSEPGLPLPNNGATLPIAWDSFTDFGLARLNQPLFSNFLATLNGLGAGTAQLNAPALNPGKIGKVMTFAYCLQGNPDWDFASNPVTVEIVP